MELIGFLTQILELFNGLSSRVFRLEQRDWKFKEEIMAIKATAEQTRLAAAEALAKVAAEHVQLEAIAANVAKLEELIGDVEGAEEILNLVNAQLADAGNRVEGYSELFNKPDTLPPSVPTGLAGTAIGANDVNLSWNASTDNIGVANYEVFQDGASIGTPTGTSFAVTGLTAETTYLFSVRSKDTAGNFSAVSDSVSVVTPV